MLDEKYQIFLSNYIIKKRKKERQKVRCYSIKKDRKLDVIQ